MANKLKKLMKPILKQKCSEAYQAGYRKGIEDGWKKKLMAYESEMDYLKTIQFALHRSVPKWIPVSEQLPRPNKLVLCWWESGDGEKEHYGFATFQSHGVWYVSNEGMPKVTHWMPLPEPPEVH